MIILFFIIGALSLIAVIINLTLLLFKPFRPRAKRAAVLSGAIFVISFILLVVQVVVQDENDEKARKQGFANASEQRKAGEVGITNSATWRERLRLEAETKRLAEEENEKERKVREDKKLRALALQQALLKPPIEQDRFIQAIEKARTAYKAGQTDLQRGASRPMRAQEICAALPSSELNGWVGQIQLLTTNGSGDGVLVVELSRDIKLLTMPTSFTDTTYKTMVRPGSPLYQSLLEMKEGDFVHFDASLFPAEDDCYKEMSLTMQGSIEKPEFVTRFNRVTRIDLPSQ